MLPSMKILLASVLSFTMVTAFAQAPKITPAQKTKIILKTSLGNYSDSVITTVDELLQSIALPLTVTDDKKNTYHIITYRFLYKRQGITENEEMDRVYPATSVVSGQFNTATLPDLWLSTIREELKPGEELYFFDIGVKDAQGKLMIAPNLKIITR
jgi:hypothetical protein